MKRALAVALLASALSAQEPRARVRIAEDGPIAPGQTVRFVADVLVPSWFTGAPQWPEIDVAGGLVFLPTTPTVNFTERIEGATWAGQSRDYFLCPLRAGEIEVPAISVTLKYSIGGKSSDPTPVEVPAQRFRVEVPVAARGERFYLTSRAFSLTESIEPPLQDLQVGDAVTRTIEMAARDTFGLFLPPLRFKAQDGMSTYPARPEVEDRGGERGEARTAYRVEKVTYVFEREGSYVLPALRIPWWNPEAGRLETAELPVHELAVAANPDALTATDEPDAEATGGTPWLLAVLIAALAVLCWVFRTLPSAFVAWRQRRARAEPAVFQRLLRTCRSQDARATVNGVYAWLAHPALEGPRAALTADPTLAGELEALDRHLFGSGGSWSSAGLCRALVAARRAQRGRRRPRHGDLAPLVPAVPDRGKR